ncbi:formate dehydrogenase accessory protein FdhE [Pandoraea pulmonicola]|uniref:Protein FdhE homolog n=2 Tax=Pandoraea pulmonicola TaxID=93221 RepID=A0AAJ5CZD0_PANPU|nr:formate dehydrogenase accessory protein FdhE [Pandoraea pulmonicola]SUA89405.1 formate dehydrogenase accessory protein FdhE [Pandoraea pulmonicola]
MQRILQPGQIESLDRTAIPRLRMPQRAEVFSARAGRLRQLAEGHPLGDYLRLMALVADAQQRLLDTLDAPRPSPEAIAQAQQHCMPLVPATGGYEAGRWQPLLMSLLDAVAAQVGPLGLPGGVRTVLDKIRSADAGTLDMSAQSLLAGHGKGVDAAGAPFLMAALQVLWTGVASQFDAGEVPMLDVPNVCPMCGTLPVASVVRIGGAHEGYRYLACGLCSTEWHMVRVKCTHCEASEHVAYHVVDKAGDGAALDAKAAEALDAPSARTDEGAASAEGRQKLHGLDEAAKRVASSPIRAESCDDCHSYRKIFYQDKDPFVEPVADDLASLALDVLMGEAGYARANGNPLLWQGAEE